VVSQRKVVLKTRKGFLSKEQGRRRVMAAPETQSQRVGSSRQIRNLKMAKTKDPQGQTSLAKGSPQRLSSVRSWPGKRHLAGSSQAKQWSMQMQRSMMAGYMYTAKMFKMEQRWRWAKWCYSMCTQMLAAWVQRSACPVEGA